jgi:hypothetical protein
MIWFVLMIFSSFAMRYLLFGRKEKCTF